MNGPVGKKQPFPLSLRYIALNHDRVQAARRGISVLRHEKTYVTSISDHDVAMDFGLHTVEIVDEVFLIRDALRKAALSSLASGFPPVVHPSPWTNLKSLARTLST